MDIEGLFEAIQEEALPAVWSRGVARARRNALLKDAATDSEIILRVTIENRAVSPKVTLWPDDGDWYCDCGDRNDPCEHVAAGVIWVKRLVDSGEWENAPAAQAAAAPAPNAAYLRYDFRRLDGALALERSMVGPSGATPLSGSLVATVGGIRSGRVRGPDISATKLDFTIDSILAPSKTGLMGVGGPVYSPARPLGREMLAALLGALQDSSHVTLDGAPVNVSGRGVKTRARVRDENGGFRLERARDAGISEVFSNGAALAEGVLHPIEDPGLSPREREWLPREGLFIPAPQAGRLVTEILPALREKIDVDIETARLPAILREPPRAEIRLAELSPTELTATPVIVYGDPAVAELRENRLELIEARASGRRSGAGSAAPVRDIQAERALILQIQDVLHLQPGRPTRFSGEDAVRFTRVLRERLSGASAGGGLERIRITGDGARAFTPLGRLVPRPRFEDGRLSIDFMLEGATAGIGGRAGGGSDIGTAAAGAEQVFGAWRENASLVPLAGGGWAELPKDWLHRYGESALELLAARDVSGKTPSCLVSEVKRLFDESGTEAPPSVASLADALAGTGGIPEAELPGDLRAELRSYQRAGVNWLCFLRDHGMGALLADDMGLGKTLQALCAVRGRTLIAAPTSVLYSWSEQIRRFRPDTKFCVYHGPQRRLDENASIVITSHAILRIDLEKLAAREWDMMILDEAHAIKNPDSQLARAVFGVDAAFRLALTGTPVENRLTDIWSLYRFLNPGLLGSRSEFMERFGAATGGTGGERGELTRRIRPFLLRRLKKDVAKELPPRTESVLECELPDEERELYETILAATRKEVLDKLESGSGVFAALEALLRLRQACCHPALVPGQSAATSAKLELLAESLVESIEAGHRALVFSQWTSFLDLIEPALASRGIRFGRLDGTTRDRGAVVENFQSPDGPSVLLMSLKAGGVGLTLTAADHVYITDPWWNPFAEDQAADRAHRIGQENPVMIYRLIASATIEERVLELQDAKRALAATVLEGADTAAGLTRDDVIALLT